MRTLKLVQLTIVVIILFVSCEEESLIDNEHLPTVHIANPVEGQIISGPIPIEVEVQHDRPVTVVNFYCDLERIGYDSTRPFRYIWNAGFLADGRKHILFARAIDNQGKSGESNKIQITIDTNATALRISSPIEGSTIRGPLLITLDTNLLGSVSRVEFLINNQILGIDSTRPFEQYWFAPFWADGNTHTVQAVAIDSSQRVGKSQIVSVTVATSASIYPQINSPTNSIYIETRPIHFVWYKVPTAVNYIIEASEFPDFNHIDFSITTADTSTYWSLPQLSLFGWRVKALNKFNRSTAWSPSAEFATIITFSKSYPSTESSEIQSATEISNGGYIVAARTTYGNEFVCNTMKLNKLGDVIWERTHSMEQGKIKETTDQGFVVVGWTSNSTAVILKLNSQGIESWGQTFGNYRGQYFRDVLQKADGSFIVAASIEQEQRSGWLLAFAPNGDTLWTRIYSATGDMELFKVSQLNDETLVFAGNYRGWIDSATFYPTVAWLMHTNQVGDSLWYKTYNHGSGTYLLSMAKGAIDFVLAGFTYVSSSSFCRIWLAKSKLDGDLLWSKDYGSTGQESAADVITLDEGGYVITGGYETSSWSTCDIFLMNLDENGNQRWFRRYGNDGPDYSYSVARVSDGGYLVGGSRSVINKGRRMWLIKTDKHGRIKFSD